MIIGVGDDGSVKISASAYVKAKVEFYLPKPLAEYPRFDTPSSPQLSKAGALIYAPLCGRPGESFAIGILARALTFPTPEIDEHANRVLAHMAQTADEGLRCRTAPSGSIATISLSSTEAEIIAASHTAAEVIYLCGLLAETGHAQGSPTPLYVDNSEAVERSNERRFCQRSRQVDRRDLRCASTWRTGASRCA
eukprot:6201347-Pleurochrysis_carterae.AAC.1